MIEEWKRIEEFPNYYISNTGKVKGYNFIKSTFINNCGYECIIFKVGNKQNLRLIHRLVAQYFVDGWFEGAQVNHKDENKLNNNSDNLEWCSRSYNANYGHRNNKHSKKIKCIENNTIYDSIVNATKVLPITRQGIYISIKKNRPVNGMTFVYVDD